MTNEEKLQNYEFVKKCIHWAWDKDHSEDFFFYWAGQSGNSAISISINCNDLFHWGCADSEEVTPENFHLLEQSREELLALCEEGWFVPSDMLALLFCCKSREMRPQSPYYQHIDRRYWPLIDACGPKRDDQMDVEEYLQLKNNTSKR